MQKIATCRLSLAKGGNILQLDQGDEQPFILGNSGLLRIVDYFSALGLGIALVIIIRSFQVQVQVLM